MTSLPSIDLSDESDARKNRGAFFTPSALTRFIVDWAIRSHDDTVLEPSAGDAAFLVEAVRALQALGAEFPRVTGIEIHEASARRGTARVREAGGDPHLVVSDFFDVIHSERYSVVIGNPPYIRFQEFKKHGLVARAAALQSGVPLSGLASSWAAFTVHAASLLKKGGRLGLVLPAELLSVNYAAPVREHLFLKFRSIELVLFSEQVFPEAEADVILLLADGYDEGPTDHATLRQSQNASTLTSLSGVSRWSPPSAAGKWTGLLTDRRATAGLQEFVASGAFVGLEAWGDTTLGMVTGNNSYFALSPARARALGIGEEELLRLSPPGSSHLRGLELSNGLLKSLGAGGKSTLLFRPDPNNLSREARSYISAGEVAGVNQAYKCRIRKDWYQVPLVAPADLLLTYMNADTPRLTTNIAGAHHLNSVHGVYLRPPCRVIGLELLPIASLNSVSLLSAELVGRSYGGGVLKLEPREADAWAMPSPERVMQKASQLQSAKEEVAASLSRGELLGAVSIVDQILFGDGDRELVRVELIRNAREKMALRRGLRGERGR